jgi:formylglycine-generating enzyme required for sulfatase activity
MAVGTWLGRLLGLRTRLGDLTIAAAAVAASFAIALAIAFAAVRPEWFQAPRPIVTWERRALPVPTAPTPARPQVPPASPPPKLQVRLPPPPGQGPAQNIARTAVAPATGPPAAGWTLLAAGEDPKPFEVFRDCPDCLDMVALPGGTFTMGSPKDEPGRGSDENQTTVTLPGFAISRFPVTRGQYAAFVAATGRPTKSGCYVGAADGKGTPIESPEATWRGPGFAQDDSHPVVCVDWSDAAAYAAWLKSKTGHDYRLLSSAEYEYANRAGTKTAYFWGQDANAGCAFANMADAAAKRANPGWTTVTCDDGYIYTSPVGHFSANSWGLYDVTGNVASWTADCYSDSIDYNTRGFRMNGSGNCSLRVLRGGSWNSFPRGARAADRVNLSATDRDDSFGFRLARTLSPAPS